jgi:hypothetical protein
VSFDAHATLVWLDPDTDEPGATALLCARHAESLVPPRGWNVQDRRTNAPRLFRPAGVAGRAPRPPDRRGASSDRRDMTELPFGAPQPAPATRTVPPATASPEDELERYLDARTPLLARAFQGVRPRV